MLGLFMFLSFEMDKASPKVTVLIKVMDKVIKAKQVKDLFLSMTNQSSLLAKYL